MFSLIKNNKTLFVTFILIFIILLILGKFNFIWWIADGALFLILIIILISIRNKQMSQKANLPENMNYYRIFMNINKHSQNILGKSYKSITYMYVNIDSKIITFPESKYYLNRKYHLINFKAFDKRNLKILLTLSIVNKSTNNIHVQISDVNDKGIKLLKLLIE